MSIDNKRLKEFNRYSVHRWMEESFFKRIEFITLCATESIQEISLDSGEQIYLVPKSFYKQARLAIDIIKQEAISYP